MYGYAMKKKELQDRLRRIEGQVRGLQRMVDEDQYCIDILTQVNSVQAALRAVGMGLLDDHVRHCVRESIEQGEGDEKVEELMAAVVGWPGSDGMATREVVLDIEGMTCASCVSKVETRSAAWQVSTAQREPGDPDGDGAHRTRAVPTDVAPLIGAVRRVGYGAHQHGEDRPSARSEIRAYLRRLRARPHVHRARADPDDGGARRRLGRGGDAGRSRRRSSSTAAGRSFARRPGRPATHDDDGHADRDRRLAAYGYSVVAIASGYRPAATSTPPRVIVTLILVGKTLEARARASAGDAARTLHGAGRQGRDGPGRRRGTHVCRSTSCGPVTWSWSCRERRSPPTGS